MTRNETVEFIHSLFEKVWSNLEEEQLSNFYDQNIKGYIANTIIGFDDIKNRLRHIKSHYQELKSTLKDIIIENDKVVVHVAQTYLDKNNKKEVYDVVGIYKMQNNKIVEAHANVSPNIDYLPKAN